MAAKDPRNYPKHSQMFTELPRGSTEQEGFDSTSTGTTSSQGNQHHNSTIHLDCTSYHQGGLTCHQNILVVWRIYKEKLHTTSFWLTSPQLFGWLLQAKRRGNLDSTTSFETYYDNNLLRNGHVMVIFLFWVCVRPSQSKLVESLGNQVRPRENNLGVIYQKWPEWVGWISLTF